MLKKYAIVSVIHGSNRLSNVGSQLAVGLSTNSYLSPKTDSEAVSVRLIKLKRIAPMAMRFVPLNEGGPEVTRYINYSVIASTLYHSV